MKNIIGLLIVTSLVLASCSSAEDTTTATDNSDTANTQADMNSEDIVDGQAGTTADESVIPTFDIVETAMSTNNVTTLVAALRAAGLVETLKSAGPFTVFAPTDEAFVALPEGTVDTLLMPENLDKLTNILTHHVVLGTYTSADLMDGMILTSLQGQDLAVTYENDIWYVNGAQVQTADVVTSN
jgi:uncharacterized surface protein with fasciclin (FAS1) repeats